MPLLATRRFLPLFITQFLGAFNDNLFKNALVMLVAFKLEHDAFMPPHQLIIMAGALFILPYFLFSATAGQLADKLDRARMARITKVWEIVIVAVGAVGFILHHEIFLLLVLFGLGVQSTFFGPVKYALLPQHLHDDELVAGNAMIEAGTFLAILLGTILGGVVIMQDGGEYAIVTCTLLVALGGYMASRFIPPAPAPEPELSMQYNIAKVTWGMVQRDRENRRVFRCILGISWFWLVGAVFLSQFPALVKDIIGGNEGVVTLFLTMFSLGIGIGSFASSALAKGKIDSHFAPYAAFGMSFFMADLAIACITHSPPGDTLMGVYAFLQSWVSIRILADLFAIAVCGGLFVVPLYAIMQHESDPRFRARTIATNNVINALFMVVSAIVTAMLLAEGYTIVHLFAIMAACNLFVGFVIRRLRRS